VNLLQNRIGIDQANALAGILNEYPTLKSLCGNKGDETELDMSGKAMDTGDIIMLAAEIVGNGAISSVNLLGNAIPVEQAQDLVKIMQSKEKLITLCGLRKEETELDFSGRRLGAGDAVLIANDISDMGALTKFDISKNCLYAAGGKAVAEALKDNQVITELNIASNRLGCKTRSDLDGADMSGVVALADVIPDMGALAKLDMSTNDIGAEQEEDLQRICMAGGIELTK
jgi:Ran GTPase-activating protein (RanGAP) involved in mRNA processing and transport